MFNILTDDLPKTVTVDEREYEIRWWFRSMVKLAILLQDNDLEESHKRALALNMFYPIIPDNIQEAERQLYQFYTGDKPQNPAQIRMNKKHAGKPPVFSYEHDDEYVFAAFLQQYGINLNTVEGLHWYEFRAMFRSLTESRITEAMGYRGLDLARIKDAKERQRLREIKALWAIPSPQSEIDDEIAEALRGGGDVSALMERRSANAGRDD